jgi:ribose transport system substrate-binding protein
MDTQEPAGVDLIKIITSASGTMTEKDLIEKFGETPQPSKTYKIGAVVKTLMGEHWQEVARGYEEAAEKFGIEIDIQGGKDEQDLTGQLAAAETMVRKNYDLLLFSPISESNLDPAIKAATEAGIPVINVDFETINPEVLKTVYIGFDDHSLMGKWVAEIFIEQLPAGSKVAHIEGLGGALAAEQRKAGFTDTINEDGSLELVASQPANWDRKLAYDAATNIIKQHPDIKGFYCANDTMALGVVEAVIAAGKQDDILVYGTDGIPDAIEQIKAGNLTGTVAQFASETGRIGLETAIRILEGQQVGDVILSTVEVIDQDNVYEFFPE